MGSYQLILMRLAETAIWMEILRNLIGKTTWLSGRGKHDYILIEEY